MSVRILPIIILLVLLSNCKKETVINRQSLQNESIDPILDTLPINQLQIIGSHNSYRRRTDQDIYNLVNKLKGILPNDLDPRGWDYNHIPIIEQLDLGLRSLELDFYYDPNGGKYFNRLGNVLVGRSVASGIEELKAPGMKIMHIPDLDYNTHYYTLKNCLKEIKNWSANHPQHLPLFILLEDKDFAVGNVLPIFTKALPFDASATEALEQEINEVFGGNTDQLFIPDDLRGNHPNLKTALQQKGWPKVKEMRGKIILIYYGNSNYTRQHPNLENRLMFQFANVNSVNAAFINGDDSDDLIKIQAAVNSGYIVRTRSDADTDEARTGDITTRENAFNSGAQIISTDYYLPDYRAGTSGWTAYQAIFTEGNYARANILNAPNIHKGKSVVE